MGFDFEDDRAEFEYERLVHEAGRCDELEEECFFCEEEAKTKKIIMAPPMIKTYNNDL